MKTLQESQQAVIEAQESAAEAKALLEFYIEFPQYACDANTNVLKQFHHGEPVTKQSLMESVEFLKGSLVVKGSDRLAHEAQQADEQDRANSLDTIKRITGEIPQTAKYMPTETLAERAARLERRRELNKKSPGELRQIIRESQKEVNRIDPLPPEYDRPTILRMEPLKLRALLRRFGQQVNDRLAGIS